jgi:hypothetical protein
MTTSMDDLVALTDAVLAPVTSKYLLAGPSVVRRNTSFSLVYVGPNLGLEVLVEVDNFFAYAMPFRPVAGRPPPEGLLGRGGTVRQMYLQEALDRLRIPHHREQAYMRSLAGGHRNGRQMLEVIAMLVDNHWPALLAASDSLFPEQADLETPSAR